MVYNKEDIIDYISKANEISKAEAKRMYEIINDAYKNILKEGNGFNIRGFIEMGVKVKPERTGTNPRTGEKITIPSCKVPYCKFKKDIKDGVK